MARQLHVRGLVVPQQREVDVVRVADGLQGSAAGSGGPVITGKAFGAVSLSYHYII